MGHANDYVLVMHLLLQQPNPDDYEIAIGETHSVRVACEVAFSHVGLDDKGYVLIDESLNLRFPLVLPLGSLLFQEHI